MNLRLKFFTAALAFAISSVALSAGFQSSQARNSVDRMELTRNHNGRFGEPSDWINRITLSGELNVDGRLSNRTTGEITSDIDLRKDLSMYGRRSSSSIALTDANLYLSARPNDWVAINLDMIAEDNEVRNNNFEAATGVIDHIKNLDTRVDEAYITLGNFHESSFYLLAGREYVPYGYYQRHPITVPLTQLLTQTNATALQLGFVDTSGFNGALFIFRGNHFDNDSTQLNLLGGTTVSGVTTFNTSITTNRRRVENGGLQLGYHYAQADTDIIVDVSWLGNIVAVDYIAAELRNFAQAVPGYSLDVVGHYQAFDGQVQYTSAAKRFDITDICKNCNGAVIPVNKAAKTRAMLLGVGYTFDLATHKNHFSINYQRSHDAIDVGEAGMAEHRWQADWTVGLYKNTDVTFEYVHDKDYSISKGGTGIKSNTGIVRFATRFA